VTSRTRYRYVDFAARGQAGFRNRIVTVDEVAAAVSEYGANECYASVFRFADDVLLYLSEHRVDGRPSIAGFDGKVWAPFVPIDIDAQPPATLDDALMLARQAYRLLVERWEMAPAAVHPYFSGAKGFHLLLDVRAFGKVSAGGDLHRLFSRVRLALLRGLPPAARHLFDLAIGDKTRLLRLPNTRHAGSGLYKIALAADELLSASMGEIVELARAPRRLARVTAAGLVPTEVVSAAPAACAVLAQCRRALQRSRGAHPYQLGTPPADPVDALCAARLALWQRSIAPGNRNNVAIRLASAFRLAGYARIRTLELLREWNQRRAIGLPEREIHGVVTSAYAPPFPYSYGCHDEVIRSVCPFVGHWNECEDYRDGTSRAGRH
jgi:hypothetical protein